jgi:hypothetical protein
LIGSKFLARTVKRNLGDEFLVESERVAADLAKAWAGWVAPQWAGSGVSDDSRISRSFSFSFFFSSPLSSLSRALTRLGKLDRAVRETRAGHPQPPQPSTPLDEADTHHHKNSLDETFIPSYTKMGKISNYAERWVLPKHDSCIAPEDVWSNKGACRWMARRRSLGRVTLAR